MDVLVELLPPSYTAKAEPSARDSRRQQPQAKQQDKTPKLARTCQKSLLKVIVKSCPESDRRTGEDRRRQRVKRGRWLESRDRHDRRAIALTVFVKV
tara:strand:+ start:4741 stop:5031 length:291 start_codon:yes stop_codon:yes gene_type:complete